jgi:putative oxidoreductase
MLDLALAIPRVIVGLLFVGHGAQKLFGWFGGHGPKGTAGFFASCGIRPAQPLAVLVGLAELCGGLGLALGLATPIAAAFISAVMLGAIALVHWPKVWVTEGGLEYPLVCLAIAAAFGIGGPGAYALDPVVGIALPMPETYLVGLLVAVVMVAVVLVARHGPADQRAGAASRA